MSGCYRRWSRNQDEETNWGFSVSVAWKVTSVRSNIWLICLLQQIKWLNHLGFFELVWSFKPGTFVFLKVRTIYFLCGEYDLCTCVLALEIAFGVTIKWFIELKAESNGTIVKVIHSLSACIVNNKPLSSSWVM